MIMCPADEAELTHMVATAAAYDDGPSALRYPRGNGRGVVMPEQADILEIGKGRIIQKGEDLAILSIGTMLETAEQVAANLAKDGHAITLADARFAKPIDTELLAELAEHHTSLLVIEEGSPGGFCAHVASWLAQEGYLDGGLRLRLAHLPDKLIDHGAQTTQLAWAGLDADTLTNTARQLLTGANTKDQRHRGSIV